MTRTHRGSATILDAETGAVVATATVVLEPRIDRRPGCWGIIADHGAGELPPSLRIVLPDLGEIRAYVDWQDAAGTARVRGGPLPEEAFAATA